MPTKQRIPKLGDLFTVRTPDEDPLTFTKGETSISVHVVKLNVPDSEAVEARATAARVRRWALITDPESDEYISHEDSVAAMAPDQMIELLVGHKMQRANVEIPLRIRNSERWATEGHLDALEEAWYGDKQTIGLMYVFASGEDVIEKMEDEVRREEMRLEWAEANRIWAELVEYQEELNAALEEQREELAEDFDGDEDDPEFVEDLRQRTAEMMRRMDADLTYLEELRRQRIFYAVRQVDDWRKRYFETLREVDDLPEWVQAQIMDRYNEISVTPQEGKGSPGTPGSSASSDPSDEVDPSHPSGLEVASA